MKLTDAERLILINQYKILELLQPTHEDDEPWNKWMIEELEGGFHDNGRYDHYHPGLKPSISQKRLDFADNVMDLYEDTPDRRFYGFEDPELNRYAEWCHVVRLRKGTPPTDAEYRAMLEQYKADGHKLFTERAPMLAKEAA